jgi:hypothetical protein
VTAATVAISLLSHLLKHATGSNTGRYLKMKAIPAISKK